MATIRVGNCSGFYGDRFSAMREMLELGELDYLTGDYLAELTMLILGRDRMRDGGLGYAKSFVRQATESMAIAQERGVRIVVNAGGLNPAGLAVKLRELAAEQGLNPAIAHIEGDDLMARSGELGFDGALTANAYLGACGIASALTQGADIVITGRVTDASLVVGPAIAAFNWARRDFDQLAGAVVAGHIIECGTQATGGNFAGFASLPDETWQKPLGFPIAELSDDGSSVITKHEPTGGLVSVDTVTAQLVYEIGSPVYLNPDVSVHLDSIRLSQEAHNRVRVSGVVGTAPPAMSKICLNKLGGFRNSIEFVLTGLDIEAKARWVRRQLEHSWTENPPDEVHWRLERTDQMDSRTQAAASSVLRCHVKSGSQERVDRAFTDAAIELALSSYPGFTMNSLPAKAAPFGIYRAAFIPQQYVPHFVVHPDGRREDIASPDITTEIADRREDVAGARHQELTGPTSRAPLGAVVYARSGDKGGDANLGVWIPADHPLREAAYDWLAGFFTEDMVRELLPETAELNVAVHRLPHLAAVNVVIGELLGEGVASSTRFDPQAKALGEWLRSRWVDLPIRLLEEKA